MVIENNMSTKLVLTFCLICCTAYGCSNAPKSIKQNSPEWQPTSNESQERIIENYVDALDEFSKVLPVIDDDTEALWVADTVHIMASAFKKGNHSLPKDMANICHILGK
jgi:hypothetical protein